MIEPAAGADRATLAFMVDAYDEEEVEGRERVLLRLHPRLAPVKVAVLPLVNKDGQPEKARAIYEDLRRRMPAEYDAGGSIGKRYRRQDEIGTPWGVTVDHQTMEDDTVTLRDRDSLDQTRIAIESWTLARAELERPAERAGLSRKSPKLELTMQRRERRGIGAYLVTVERRGVSPLQAQLLVRARSRKAAGELAAFIAERDRGGMFQSTKVRRAAKDESAFPVLAYDDAL